MNWLQKINSNILVLIVATLHIFTRQWPYGSGLQTVADVAIVAALVLMGVKYLLVRRAGR